MMNFGRAEPATSLSLISRFVGEWISNCILKFQTCFIISGFLEKALGNLFASRDPLSHIGFSYWPEHVNYFHYMYATIIVFQGNNTNSKGLEQLARETDTKISSRVYEIACRCSDDSLQKDLQICSWVVFSNSNHYASQNRKDWRQKQSFENVIQVARKGGDACLARFMIADTLQGGL